MSTSIDVLPPVDYQFRAEVDGSPWLLREVAIHEALSADFVAEVDLENDDQLADPAALLGTKATIALSRPTPDPLFRSWSGIVRAVHEPVGMDLAGRKRCRVVIEPAFACLKEERLTRKFQGVTVPEVVKEILRDFGQAFEREADLQLQRETESPSSGRGFGSRDLCVQYGETTFDFLRRIMAEEGMTYFFEQGEEREKLVIVDGNSGFHTAAESYPLRPLHGGATSREAVHSFALAHGRTATRAEVRTFNLTQHRMVLEARERDDEGGGAGRGDAEVYLPGPEVTLFGYEGDAYRRDDAAVQARLTLERSASSAVIGTGTGDVIAFQPGLVFELEPDEAALSAAAGKYLLVSVRHHGKNPERLASDTDKPVPYSNEFTLVPAQTPYRPPLLPKPVAVEDWGIVVSAIEGDPIYTDPHGRVRVRFGYDRDESAPPERCSPWLPVSQAWAGAGYGVQIIPRAGMLVRLRYLFGDPDRPFVAGCLPTGTNVLPSRPPEEKTRLTIRTRSLRDGGNDLEHFNEITLDDAADHEEVFIHAGRNYRRKVLNDERVEVDHDEQRVVGHDQALEVRGSREKTVHQDETILVKKKRSTTIQGDDERHVHGKDKLTVEKDQTIEIGGTRSTTVHELDKGTFLAGREESVKGDDQLHVSQKLTTIADEEWRAAQGPTELVLKEGDALLKAGGKITLQVKGARLRMDSDGSAILECNDKISLLCGEASIVMLPDRIEVAAPEVQLTGTNGSIKLDQSGATTTGLNISSTATVTNEITGAFVKAN